MRPLTALLLIIPMLAMVGCPAEENLPAEEANNSEDHNIEAVHQIEGADLADYGNSIVGVVARIAHLEEEVEEAEGKIGPLRERVEDQQSRKTCYQKDGRLCGACRDEISDTISEYEALQERIARFTREQEMLTDIRDRYSSVTPSFAQGDSTPIDLLERDIREQAEEPAEDEVKESLKTQVDKRK